MEQKQRRQQLPALTGIRCFAALNLVFFHFSNPQWFGPFAPIVNGGYVSVSFFLLLSGFILTYNYAERAEQGKLSARSFWQARFSRLYPVYIFSLVLSAGMLVQEFHAQTRPDFAAGLLLTPLLLQGWHPALSTFWNTPAWTMSTEAFFYVLFPWLITLRRPRTGRSILLLMLGLWGLGLVLPLLYIHFNPDGDANVGRYSSGIWLRALKFMPMQHVPSFLFGMALAFLNDLIPRESRKRLAAGAFAFAALYLILFFSDHVPYVLLHDGLLMPLYAGVILCLAGTNSVSRIFGFLPFIAIGEASYCLYLLHFNLWNMLHDSHFLEKSGLIAFDPWISYLLLIVAALLTKRLIERPARNWISRQFRASSSSA
ncbi:MAG TPA: acyltransferase [Acidobacteriaceae bacterium]|nr:acyltransferase [Acidobacteriaceae bacterium]